MPTSPPPPPTQPIPIPPRPQPDPHQQSIPHLNPALIPPDIVDMSTSAIDSITDLTPGFLISAGTVTINVGTNRVLLIHHTTSNRYWFPKGRIDTNIALPQAARNETANLTGYKPELAFHSLPINTAPTLNTPWHSEPIAVQQWLQHDDIRSFVFWFLTNWESGMEVDEDRRREMLLGEWRPEWVEMYKVEGVLGSEGERIVWRKALEAHGARKRDVVDPGLLTNGDRLHH